MNYRQLTPGAKISDMGVPENKDEIERDREGGRSTPVDDPELESEGIYRFDLKRTQNVSQKPRRTQKASLSPD